MKKKIHILSLGLTIFFFILMLVVDYFPEAINIQLRTILFLLISFVIISGLTEDRANYESNSNISKMSTLIIGTSIMLLLIILTLIGGQSQSGISINNPLTWLVYLASIIPVFFNKKHNVNNNL